jgi:hypothetical protein
MRPVLKRREAGEYSAIAPQIELFDVVAVSRSGAPLTRGHTYARAPAQLRGGDCNLRQQPKWITAAQLFNFQWLA